MKTKTSLVLRLCASLVGANAWAEAKSFEAALNAGMSRHPNIQKATAEKGAAEARALPLSLAALPQVSLSAREAVSWMGNPSNEATSRSTFAGATGSLNLYRSGADLASMNLASLQKKSAALQFVSQELSVEQEVAQALLDNIRLRASIEIAKVRFDQKQHALDVAKLRFEKGLIPEQEVDKLRVELSQARAQSSDAKSRLTENSNLVEALLEGASLGGDWPWLARIKEGKLYEKLVEKNKVSAGSTVPLQLAEFAVEAAEKQRLRARGAFLPTLDLSASYGLTRDRNTFANTQSAAVSVGIAVPLFDQLQSYSAYRDGVFQESVARAQLELQRRTANSALLSSDQNLKASFETAIERDALLVRAKALFDRSVGLFQSGRMSVNELGFDLDRWQLSQSLALQGWSDAHLAVVEFCHVRGKKIADCL